VKYFMFTEDVQNYNPQTVAVFQIDHQTRNDCNISVGTGDPTYASSKKSFSPYYLDGGYHPFPNNKIVFDITELQPEDEDFFISIYDYGSYGTTDTGALTYFSIESYSTYDKDGDPDFMLVADDTPVSTLNDVKVYSIIPYSSQMMPPILSYPSPSYSMGSVAPIFTWDEVENAITYNIEISLNGAIDQEGGFISTVYSENTAAPGQNCFIRPSQQLAQGTYYWHVQAVNGQGQAGPWSDTWVIDIVPGTTYLFNPGWTLWSFPYMPSSIELDTLLQGMEDKIDYVYRWDPSYGIYEYSYYYQGYGWVGDFNTVDNVHGYWFHSTADNVFDMHVDDGCSSTTSINIMEGWNLLSWPKKESISLNDACADISGHVDYVYRWNSFLEEYEYSYYDVEYGWVGDFNFFDPGYGYWLHSDSEQVWDLP